MKSLGCFLILTLLTFPGLAAISPQLREEIKSPDEKVRAEAAEKLGKSEDAEAVPVLAAALGDASEKVRRKIVIALDRIRLPATFTPLIRATTDPSPEVARLAVLSLVNYYTGGELNLGLTERVKTIGRKVTRSFEPDDTRIDPDVKVAPQVIAGLKEVLHQDRSWEVQRAAAWGLGALLARSAVPLLVKAAHSFEETLAREALHALTKILDRSAGPQLVDLLQSAHKEVRKDASLTVGVLRTEPAVPALTTLYRKDKDKKVRERALEGLAFIGDARATPLFEEALQQRNPNFRLSAAEGFARVGDRKWAEPLKVAMAEESNGKVRLAMAFALTALGEYDYVVDLVQQLGSRFRRTFARAYLIELSRKSEVRSHLHPHLNHHAIDVRKNLCQVLLYHGDRETLAALEPLTDDPASDVAVEALRATRVIRAREMAAGDRQGTP